MWDSGCLTWLFDEPAPKPISTPYRRHHDQSSQTELEPQAARTEAARELPASVPVLSRRTLFFYGLGSAGEATDSALAGSLALFYNQILGLEPAYTGAVSAISSGIDAVADPLIGTISDRHRSSSLGRRPPFLFGTILPIATTLCLLFLPSGYLVPSDGSPAGVGLFVWYLVLRIILSAAGTAFHVPYLALGAELSDGYHSRSTVMAVMNLGRTFISLALTALQFLVIFPRYPKV